MLSLKSAAIISSICLLLYGSDGSTYLAQTQKDPGSITGKVKLDGKPAKGITIIATPAATDATKMVEQMFKSAPSLKATTDADGVYKLEGVPPGKYVVNPSAPALVNDNAKRSGEMTVAEGEVTEGVDFEVSSGGVVTGKLTDAEGRPIIGERIALKFLDGPDDSPVSGAASFGNRMYTTDDRGIYRIFGLRPGRYIVSAGKESDQIASFLTQRAKRVQTYYPGVTEESKAKPVQVTAGSEASGVDIQFSSTDKGFVISGRVLDSQNKAPIANAMVAYARVKKVTTDQTNATDDDDADIHISTSGAAVSVLPGGFTTTNEKGEFRFNAVSPGNYKLEATSIGAFAGTGGSQFYADPVFFEVSSSNLDKLELKVHRGAAIAGVVVIESADSQDSLDRYGQLVLMAMVIDSATKSFSSGNAIVGADGTFRLGGLKAGKVSFRTFSMSARKPGILRIERNGVEVQSALEIQPNEEINGLRVILAPATNAIRGRVTVQGGALPKGAQISVRARLAGSMSSDSNTDGDPGQTADVSPNGSFVLESLLPGTYELLVSASVPGERGPRMVTATQTVTVTGNGPVEVDVVLDISRKSSDK